MNSFGISIFLGLSSAFLLALSSIEAIGPFFLFICYVPFFIGIEKLKTFKSALGYAFLFNVVSSFFLHFWVVTGSQNWHGYGLEKALPFHLLISATGQLEAMAMGPLWFFLRKKLSPGLSILIVSMLGAFISTHEYLLGQADVAYLMAPLHWPSQWAWIGGTSLVYFFLVAQNLTIVEFVQRRSLKNLIGVIGVLVIFILGGMALTILKDSTAIPKKNIRLGIVQGNFGPKEKLAIARGDKKTYQEFLNYYIQQTKEMLSKNKGVEVVFWPETIFQLNALEANQDFSIFDENFSQYEVTLVFGAQINVVKERHANLIVAYAPHLKRMMKVYQKHNLLPFGEEEYFRKGSGERFLKAPLKEFDSLNLSPSICYEAEFPEHFLADEARHVELLFNAANTTWFGDRLQRAHLGSVIMRSIELGVVGVLASENGYSSVIDGNGKRLHTLPAGKGKLVSNVGLSKRSESWPVRVLGIHWFGYGSGLMLVFIAFLRSIFRFRPILVKYF